MSTDNNDNEEEFGKNDVLLCDQRGKGHIGNICFRRFMQVQKNLIHKIILDTGREEYATSTKYTKFVDSIVEILERSRQIWIQKSPNNNSNNNEEKGCYVKVPLDSDCIREFLRNYTYENIEFDEALKVWLKLEKEKLKNKQEQLVIENEKQNNNKKVMEETESSNNLDSKIDDKKGIVLEDAFEKQYSTVEDVDNVASLSPPSPLRNEIEEKRITKELAAATSLSPPSLPPITNSVEAGAHNTCKTISSQHGTGKRIISHEKIRLIALQESAKLKRGGINSTSKLSQRVNQSTSPTSLQEDVNLNKEENPTEKKENGQSTRVDKQDMDESYPEDELMPEASQPELKLSQDLSEKCTSSESLKSQRRMDDDSENEPFFSTPSMSGVARHNESNQNKSAGEKSSAIEQHMVKSEFQSDSPPGKSKLKSHRCKINVQNRHVPSSDQKKTKEEEIENEAESNVVEQKCRRSRPPKSKRECDYSRHKHQVDDNNAKDGSVLPEMKSKFNHFQVDNNSEDKSKIPKTKKLKAKKRFSDKETFLEADREKLYDSTENKALLDHSKIKSRNRDNKRKAKQLFTTAQHRLGDNTEDESLSASHQDKSKIQKPLSRKGKKIHPTFTKKQQADDNAEDASSPLTVHDKFIDSKHRDRKLNNDSDGCRPINEKYNDQPAPRSKHEVIVHRQSMRVPLPEHGPLRPDASESTLPGPPYHDYFLGAEHTRYFEPQNFVESPHFHAPTGHLNLSGREMGSYNNVHANYGHQLQGPSSFPAGSAGTCKGDGAPNPLSWELDDRRQSMHQGLSGRSFGPTTAHRFVGIPGQYQTDSARNLGFVPDFYRPAPSQQTPSSPIFPRGPQYPTQSEQSLPPGVSDSTPPQQTPPSPVLPPGPQCPKSDQ